MEIVLVALVLIEALMMLALRHRGDEEYARGYANGHRDHELGIDLREEDQA